MLPGYRDDVPHHPVNHPVKGLLVCTGKDCRHDAGYSALITMAGDSDGALEVPCQGLCNGPVVGCRVNGEIRWFTKVRSPKRLAAVALLLRTGRVTERLRKRESRKHRGELRGGRRVRPLSGP